MTGVPDAALPPTPAGPAVQVAVAAGAVGVAGLAIADAVVAGSPGPGVATLLLVSAVVLLALLAATAVLLVRFVRPMRSLTAAAHRSVHASLPAALAALDGSTGTAPVPSLPAITAPGPLAPLAQLFSTVQSDAVERAAAHHRREHDSRQMQITMGRRTQSLLTRTLTYVSALEATEQDAGILAQLFRIDHAATRIRRNSESMLVLAGAVPARGSSRPAAVEDVVRGALSEIEDHIRVDVTVRPAAIAGSAVPDLVHLLAELIENATHFSPPSTRVVVTGGPAGDGEGYLLRIADEGVGMSGPDLDDAHSRLRRAARGRTSTRLLGLDVVGLLADRNGVRVTLDAVRGSGSGITATVVVPATVQAPLSDLPPPPAAPRLPVAAAFMPPAARPRGSSGTAAPPEPGPAPVPAVAPGRAERGPAAPPAPVAAGVPRRVRGAQLPDLGPAGDDGPRVAPDARRVRGRLTALQDGLTAARTSNIPPSPRPHPAPAATPARVAADDGPQPAAGS